MTEYNHNLPDDVSGGSHQTPLNNRESLLQGSLSRQSSFSLDSNDSFPSTISDSSNLQPTPPCHIPDGADIWGIGVPVLDSLSNSALGKAVVQKDFRCVQSLLSQDPSAALLQDHSGNNMLHFMADSTISDRAQARHDWNRNLDATREITKILIRSGLNIEARNDSDLTPLLLSVIKWQMLEIFDMNNQTQLPWIEGYATIALIEAGASLRIDIAYQRGSCYDSFLKLWISMAEKDFCHSETYFDVLNSITQRFENLDSISGYVPLVHRIVGGDGGSPPGYHFESAIRSVLSHAKPANIDALNHDGDTPLLRLLRNFFPVQKSGFSDPLTLTIGMATILLKAGAQLDFISSRGNTAIFSAVSEPGLRWRSDEEDVQLMQFLLGFDPSLNVDSKLQRWKLVDMTSTLALARAAFAGRPKTLRFLLDHGMDDRVGDWVEFGYPSAKPISGTLMDIAFFGAETTREDYLKYIDPEAYPDVHSSAWAYYQISRVYETRDKDTADSIGKAQYRGHKEVVQILHTLGVKRTPPNGPQDEPTYFNAVYLPARSFFNLDNANSFITNVRQEEKLCDADWGFLYEMEILDDDWEKTALADLVGIYAKMKTWPRDEVLRRWPSLVSELPFTEDEIKGELDVGISDSPTSFN
ncbi:hypothetical protein FSARC_4761 [Fusarium sarcochroum]|uniref:Ankyrin n=1 Tax=Fusarium sarcochroum TaxID=1208366 RepID=A0A8H4U0S7_9HYPO|nr:hypothetical protein FSARC_4761 [Fusarium sarcochroum]